MTTSSVNNDIEDRFNKMEHRNWEQGYEAYDRGFGPLTRQTIPTLLTNAEFPPDAGGDQRTVRLLDVATGPGFVLSAAIDAAAKQQQQSYKYHLTGIDITQNFLRLAEERTDAQLQQQKQQPAQIKVDFVEGSAESLPFAGK
jgi:ubiquinone/menaquinone biosynthesis C-methylase UbiE